MSLDYGLGTMTATTLLELCIENKTIRFSLMQKAVSHVINSRALTGEKPCINKAIHALLMHGYATFNMLVPGPQNCCRHEMFTVLP